MKNLSRFKKLIVSLAILFLASGVLLSFKKEESTIVEEEEALDEDVFQELSTKEDILLPTPTNKASEEFKKYNILEFKNLNISEGSIEAEIYNKSKKVVKMPSIVLFDDTDKNSIQNISFSNEEISSNGSISIKEKIDELKDPKLLQYSYLAEVNGVERFVYVDLKNQAAYADTDIPTDPM